MCTQKPPHDYSEQLYNRYRDAFTKYIAEKVSWLLLLPVSIKSLPWLTVTANGLQVLPTLRDHRDEFLLQELLKRWSNHKVMVRWLSRFFNYLDR